MFRVVFNAVYSIFVKHAHLAYMDSNTVYLSTILLNCFTGCLQKSLNIKNLTEG